MKSYDLRACTIYFEVKELSVVRYWLRSDVKSSGTIHNFKIITYLKHPDDSTIEARNYQIKSDVKIC